MNEKKTDFWGIRVSDQEKAQYSRNMLEVGCNDKTAWTKTCIDRGHSLILLEKLNPELAQIVTFNLEKSLQIALHSRVTGDVTNGVTKRNRR